MVRVIEKDVGAAMEMPMEKKNKKKRVILELAEIFWVEICGFYWDFFPEHTGVSARQRAGTLESVVQYDQETFAKVWDYPASNSSEDDPFFFSFFFFRNRGGIPPFFSAVRPTQGNPPTTKNKTKVQLKKRF